MTWSRLKKTLNLKKVFDRLRKYSLRLHPKKKSREEVWCFVRQATRVHCQQKTNRSRPAKAKAIIDMPVPKIEKEIRAFWGRLQYISRFIAQLTPICEPIFKLLRKERIPRLSEKIDTRNWGWQKAFDKVKKYLLNPPPRSTSLDVSVSNGSIHELCLWSARWNG